MPNTISVEDKIIIQLPCGCVYHETGWLLTRINECNYH